MSTKFKYNRALDLLAAAATVAMSASANAAEQSAKLLCAAIKDPSIKSALSAIDAANSKTHAAALRAAAANPKRVQSAAATRLKAGRRLKASDGVDPDSAGEEFRLDPQENGDRLVQEADASDIFDVEDLDASADDADLSFLDDDDEILASDAEEEEEEVEFDEAEDEALDEDALIDSVFKASVRKPAAVAKTAAKVQAKPAGAVTSAALQRAMHNALALQRLQG